MKDPELQRDTRHGAVKSIKIQLIRHTELDRKPNASDWEGFDLAPAYSNIELAEIIVEALANQGYPVRLEVLREQVDIFHTTYSPISLENK